jgi:Co/Zn/Cd efflux system component
MFIFAIASISLTLVQWQFCQRTGSVLVFGQGILQLILTIILLFLCLKPIRKWQLLAQLLNSFFVILLCGLLMSESYIRWQEGSTVLTSEALPVVLLGFGGLLLLSRLLIQFKGEQFSHLSRRMTSSLFPFLSGSLAVVLLITHLTGWYWLDIAVAFFTACLLGVVALFFLLDGYWNIMESSERT